MSKDISTERPTHKQLLSAIDFAVLTLSDLLETTPSNQSSDALNDDCRQAYQVLKKVREGVSGHRCECSDCISARKLFMRSGMEGGKALPDTVTTSGCETRMDIGSIQFLVNQVSATTATLLDSVVRGEIISSGLLSGLLESITENLNDAEDLLLNVRINTFREGLQ